jgi:hypothetical protein
MAKKRGKKKLYIFDATTVSITAFVRARSQDGAWKKLGRTWGKSPKKVRKLFCLVQNIVAEPKPGKQIPARVFAFVG